MPRIYRLIRTLSGVPQSLNTKIFVRSQTLERMVAAHVAVRTSDFHPIVLLATTIEVLSVAVHRQYDVEGETTWVPLCSRILLESCLSGVYGH